MFYIDFRYVMVEYFVKNFQKKLIIFQIPVRFEEFLLEIPKFQWGKTALHKGAFKYYISEYFKIYIKLLYVKVSKYYIRKSSSIS